jgi:Flp pilus assembly protein TadD
VALGRALEKRGEAEQAAQAYTEAVRKDSGRADAWMRLAVLADRRGAFTESADYYRKALDLKPEDPDTHCNVGYSLYLQQRWGEAEQALRRAVALKPDHQRAHTNLGLVLARVGRETEAMEEFLRAGCSDADAQVNLAYVATLNGSWAVAREHYDLALRSQPAYGPARDGLSRLDVLAAKLGRDGGRAGADLPILRVSSSDGPRPSENPPPETPAPGRGDAESKRD